MPGNNLDALKIVNLDITFLFDSLASGLTAESLLSILGYKSDEKHESFTSEKVKVFVLPEKNLVISFEFNRLIIRDIKPSPNELDRVVETAEKIFKVEIHNQKPRLVGFNFWATLDFGETKSAAIFIKDNIYNKLSDLISTSGINLEFKKDGVVSRAEIGFKNNDFTTALIHFNYEMDGSISDDFGIIKKHQVTAKKRMVEFIELLEL